MRARLAAGAEIVPIYISSPAAPPGIAVTESSVALPPEQERGHAAPPIIHISERRSYREAVQRDRVRLHKGSQHRGRSLSITASLRGYFDDLRHPLGPKER